MLDICYAYPAASRHHNQSCWFWKTIPLSEKSYEEKRKIHDRMHYQTFLHLVKNLRMIQIMKMFSHTPANQRMSLITWDFSHAWRHMSWQQGFIACMSTASIATDDNEAFHFNFKAFHFTKRKNKTKQAALPILKHGRKRRGTNGFSNTLRRTHVSSYIFTRHSTTAIWSNCYKNKNSSNFQAC